MKLNPENMIFVLPRFLLKAMGINIQKINILIKWKNHLTQKSTLSKFHKRIFKKYINKESVVIDVGANVGEYTNYFRKIARKVIAFEPDPQTFKILRKRYNKYKNTRLISIALGMKEGTIKLYRYEDSYYTSFNPNVKDHKQMGYFSVQQLNLDGFYFKPDFIKIDAEGMDLDILYGAKETLKKYHPTVLVEYVPDYLRASGHRPTEMIDFMEGLGYEFRTVDVWGRCNDLLFINRRS